MGGDRFGRGIEPDAPALGSVDLQKIRSRIFDDVRTFSTAADVQILDDAIINGLHVENEDHPIAVKPQRGRSIDRERSGDDIQTPFECRLDELADLPVKTFETLIFADNLHAAFDGFEIVARGHGGLKQREAEKHANDQRPIEPH